MEALAVLRLSEPPRRSNHRGYSDDDVDEVAPSTPYASAPSSPRRAFTKEVEEAPLGEVLAAIPFAWELVPGTPKNDVVVDAPAAVCTIFDEEETEETEGLGSSTSCSSEATSSESLSRESSKTEFDFGSRFVEPAPAEELFCNGQLVVTSLRLPPRLQHLRSLDSSCSDVSSCGGSFKSCQSPQSPRHPAGSMKLTALCGFTRTTDEETTTILGMQEQRKQRRSLSPLRLLNREAHFSSDRSNSSVSSSPSSASASYSASSSASSTNANSPQDSPAEKTSMLKDLLFTDLAMASSGRTAQLKPRQVQSKLELLKKDPVPWNRFADAEKVGRPAVNPQLSRTNARSRSSAMNTRVNSSRKENIGRAVLANRFGMLYACLGVPPESP